MHGDEPNSGRDHDSIERILDGPERRDATPVPVPFAQREREHPAAGRLCRDVLGDVAFRCHSIELVRKWRLFCYNGPYVTPTNPTQGNAGPSGFIGMEPGSWPASASTFNPPQATTALLNSSFRVPCGPGGKQGYADIAAGNGTPGRFSFVSPSSETVTAIATDASGAQITATLTMTVVSSGGL